MNNFIMIFKIIISIPWFSQIKCRNYLKKYSSLFQKMTPITHICENHKPALKCSFLRISTMLALKNICHSSNWKKKMWKKFNIASRIDMNMSFLEAMVTFKDIKLWCASLKPMCGNVATFPHHMSNVATLVHTDFSETRPVVFSRCLGIKPSCSVRAGLFWDVIE